MKTLIAALALACALPAHAELRLEGSVGMAQHALAPEGSWWYSGFDTNTKLAAGSYSLGAAWTFPTTRSWAFGLRAGYVNLGRVRSDNSFPVSEDGSVNDARVNPVCDPVTHSGCTGRYSGMGTASGWYIGPLVERRVGAFTVGGELGAYFYKSAWTADNFRIVETGEAMPGWDWDHARGRHATSYAGAGVRLGYMTLAARRYSSVHASRVELSKDFIGMTSGPVWTVAVGLSIPLDF